MNPLIELKNIVYEVNGRRILTVPHFQINEGEFLGVMGPNGAGKSSLLKILSLLEKQSSGDIFYKGQKILAGKAPIELRRKFSIALQTSLLLDTSVYENIAIGLKLRKTPARLTKEKVHLWMERFEITHLAKKNAHHLSGGEAQRVNLARAMIIGPEILFLDEPFSALDFPTKIKLMEDFRQIIEDSGTTAVFVSHDIMETRYLTKSLAIITHGEIRQTGMTQEVLEKPNPDAAVFLNEWKKFYPII